jgi:hypothetical protein
MEVLLRSNFDRNYSWRNATWRNGRYYLIDEFGLENQIRETDILAVRNDERIGKVMCSYCKELIDNNEESIKKHYEEQEAKRNCLTCEHMEIGRRNQTNRTYTPSEDGKYAVTETYIANLLCGLNYSSYDIHSESAKRYCQHTQCRRYGMSAINDIFVQYPEPFVRQITVDVLNAKKYQCEGYRNGFFVYDLKARGTLKACVNELGIVDHFIVGYRGWNYVVYYSDKYNRLFTMDSGRYRDDAVYHTSESKVNSTIAKISELFKEENTNDEK